MKSRKDEVLDALRANPNELTAQELADQLGVDRTNVSRYLNELTKDGTVKNRRTTGKVSNYYGVHGKTY